MLKFICNVNVDIIIRPMVIRNG